jgi:transposase
MLSLPPSVRIYVAKDPADMRKSFNGLSALVTGTIQRDPLSGHLFVFRNKRSDMVKILWWDRTGLVVLAKRLESSRFKFLDRALTAGQSFELSAGELMLILEGFDLEGAKRRIKNHAVS